MVLNCFIFVSTLIGSLFVAGNNIVEATSVIANGKASFTYYDSYPMCCPESPNYDPSADTEECDDYSGCDYIGDLAAFVTPTNPEGHVSLEFVQTNNLVAFYDNNDPTGKYFKRNYANKIIQITKDYNGKTYVFNATIADTCGNADCKNCCSRNAKPSGYLVDMEYYTVLNNFGTTDAVTGSLSFIVFN